MTAQRYDPLTDQSGHLKRLIQVPDGAFVLYSEHARIVASLEAQKARLLGALEALLFAEDALDSASDPECWEGPRPNLKQIAAQEAAQKLWFSAKTQARAAIAATKEDK